MTAIPTDEEWLCLAVMLALFSRRVVGALRAELVDHEHYAARYEAKLSDYIDNLTTSSGDTRISTISTHRVRIDIQKSDVGGIVMLSTDSGGTSAPTMTRSASSRLRRSRAGMQGPSASKVEISETNRDVLATLASFAKDRRLC